MKPLFEPYFPLASAEETLGGGAGGPASLSEEEFQKKLSQLKSELQGSGQPPATLEDLLKEDENGSVASSESDTHEIEELRRENEKLRTNLEQARQRVSQFEKDMELWHSREKEYEMMLEEKSELIRQLHSQMRAQPAPKAVDGPSEEELIALHQELQRERQLLEEDRLALEDQFRQSEVQMSKERSDIAKLRADVNRMQNEVKRQMEILEREAKVRGELGNFLMLREELQNNAGRGPGSRPTPTPGSSPTPVPDLPNMDRHAPDSGQKSRASFFGSLFRRTDE